MTEADVRLALHPSSFRDPTARVYHARGRILREITGKAIDDFRFVRSSGLLSRLVEKGWLVDSTEVDPSKYQFERGSCRPQALLLEHPVLPFISYPYEWPFRALQRAALLHLDVQLEALAAGATLSDATAYNIQFDGARPIFIDIASLRRYVEGEIWLAHRQFCEQFLNPLLMQAQTGIPYQAWYRGSLEGIPTEQIVRLLPWRSKANWRIFTHVVLQARLQASASSKRPEELRVSSERKLSRTAMIALLRQLRSWIESLRPRGVSATTWGEYEKSRNYDAGQQREKQRFVAEFVQAVRPRKLWDLGCNAGEYSFAALDAGAQRVIGFDFDQGALAAAFDRAEQSGAPFLPLFLDAANPSPNQGWRERERQGLQDRADCDALLALAFEHHLTIGRNVPVPDFIGWLTRLAPKGIVEFVDKSDPMVQRMLAMRRDIFPSYSLQNFDRELRERVKIIERRPVSGSHRYLYWYEK
jgi:ribosomal protein L11 methylase PrmA